MSWSQKPPTTHNPEVILELHTNTIQASGIRWEFDYPPDQILDLELPFMQRWFPGHITPEGIMKLKINVVGLGILASATSQLAKAPPIPMRLYDGTMAYHQVPPDASAAFSEFGEALASYHAALEEGDELGALEQAPAIAELVYSHPRPERNCLEKRVRMVPIYLESYLQQPNAPPE